MNTSKPSRWRKLDNAAKIFPATSGKRDTRVFRFSCDLEEAVQEEFLQEALDRTMTEYPLFASVMRKGLFWFYMEKSDIRPVARKENKPPCSNLYVRDKKSLLFKVTYHKNRINFEVFHALTDGTGAMHFLCELVKNYLLEAHKDAFPKEIPLNEQDVTTTDKEDDSFYKYYSEDVVTRKKEKIHSYQIRGLKSDYENMHITEGILDVHQVLGKAREYGVSMTVYLTAVFLCAIHREMSPRKEKHPVVLMIPVNLRKFFPSESMLNFFSWIEPGVKFSAQTTFEDVVEAVNDYFKKELTKERVAAKMSELVKLEHHPILRLAPLEMKNLFLQAGAKFSENNVTAIYSNMGVIDMPDAYAEYIDFFHVFTSTPKTELCMCSFKDKLALSFTSRFESVNIQRNFFRILAEHGLESTPIEEDFPGKEKTAYPGMQFFKIFSFICLIIGVLCGMANVIFTPDKMWSVVVVGGVLCMWLMLAIGFFKRRNLLKNAMWQLILINICCLIWDAMTGWRGWSVDFVLPGLNILTLVSMMIVTKVQHLEAQDYMIYYAMAGSLGLLPLLLLVFGVVQITWPSVFCVGFSFLFLAALSIFRRKELLAELHKKFHV